MRPTETVDLLRPTNREPPPLRGGDAWHHSRVGGFFFICRFIIAYLDNVPYSLSVDADAL